MPSHRFICLPAASCPSPPLFYRYPRLSIIPYRFLLSLPTAPSPSSSHLITLHRFLSHLTAYCLSSPLPISLPTASCHSLPPPIIPLPFLSLSTVSYYFPPLPITFHRFLSLPTASYHSSPFSVTFHRFLSLPTASYHHCSPLPVPPHRFLSLPTASYNFSLLSITLHRFPLLSTALY